VRRFNKVLHKALFVSSHGILALKHRFFNDQFAELGTTPKNYQDF